MTGLLEKDIRIILSRKQALYIFLLMGVVFGFTMGGEFIFGYLPFLFTILAISTISYDEINNGYSFLLTLPVDEKIYVQEKYVFCILAGISSWILSIGIYLISNVTKGTLMPIGELIPMFFCFLLMIFLFPSIMVPIQLKFGIERSRIVMTIIAGVFMVIPLILEKIVPKASLISWIEKLDAVSPSAVFLVLVVVVCIAVTLSYLISVNIMKKKEY
ncbi:MAG: ABC-2 transporter permease [Bacillota bacterium]|nr:ABC-2 transporter permease [Bacillota bacterium]